MDDGEYAPQSPDLSGYHSSYAPPPPNHGPTSGSSSFYQQPPPQQQYQPTSSWAPQTSYAPRSPFAEQSPFATPLTSTFSPQQHLSYPPPQQQYYPSHPQPQFPPQPPQLGFAPHFAASISGTSSHPENMPPRKTRTNPDQQDADWNPMGASAFDQPIKQQRGRKSKKQKVEEVFDKPAPGVEEGIEVKTKFPVARIKRIMQADEDVGKVAQVTPTAVSKALELFMISLVTKAATQASLKQSKKVTAAHLKAVVDTDEQFDFLAEIVSKVQEALTSKKEKEKAEEDSDDMTAGTEGKRKKATRTRRKVKLEEE
ncbi:hypothetical protein MMC25_002015 [Agyrium rufum]|nr:hypothetical protein [Agyrium rufum]